MKLGRYLDKINTLTEELEELVEKLEEKKDALEDKAMEHDRDMTDREQEKFDEYDDISYALQGAIDSLNDAYSSIEEYNEE